MRTLLNVGLLLAAVCPSTGFAQVEARNAYKSCILDQLSLVGEANLNRIDTREEFSNVLSIVAPRCWIENKMAAWEAAVGAVGIADARSLRLSEVAVDLENAIISDLVDELMP